MITNRSEMNLTQRLILVIAFLVIGLVDKVVVEAFNLGQFKLGNFITLSLKAPEDEIKRKSLRSIILDCCRRGEKNRVVVEKYIDELAELNPTPSSASSKLLAKEWLM